VKSGFRLFVGFAVLNLIRIYLIGFGVCVSAFGFANMRGDFCFVVQLYYLWNSQGYFYWGLIVVPVLPDKKRIWPVFYMIKSARRIAFL